MLIFQRVILAAVFMLCFCHAEAQLKMREVFLQMPDSIMPYLTENNRLDFLDFMDSGMKAEVRNELGGRSVMTALTDQNLSIQLSEVVRLDLWLFPVSQEVDSCRQVVCMITTYNTTVPESHA